MSVRQVLPIGGGLLFKAPTVSTRVRVIAMSMSCVRVFGLTRLFPVL